MSAMRCSTCATNWPTGYMTPCPECGGDLAYMLNASEIPRDEADSRRNHARFERYYKERQEKQLADLEAQLAK